MRSRALDVFAVSVAIAGLGASIASLIDSITAAPLFCAEDGCATVRASAWAAPLGVPLPILGIGYFTTAIVLCFVARPRIRLALALAGAGFGIALVVVQAFVIGEWCKLCLIADPAAILYAAAVIIGAGTLGRSMSHAAAVVPATALVVLSLGLWTETREPTTVVPDCVMREQVPDKVTIVEFVDFECPFCRSLDVKLSEALARTTRPVRIVRKMVPLPSHQYSVPAAMAYCAAEAQGFGDQMAKELFRADPETLTPAGGEAIALRLGCNLDEYRRTLGSAELRQRVERDVADARTAGIEGFPTIFIGTRKFEGADHPTEALLSAIERAR